MLVKLQIEAYTLLKTLSQHPLEYDEEIESLLNYQWNYELPIKPTRVL